MALQLKVITPTQNIMVHSLKKMVEFEPFSTKIEQSIISISDEASLYEKTLIQVQALQACCKAEIDFTQLPVSEISWLFMQLRKISVGKTLDLQTVCQKCEQEIKFKIDIDTIKFEPEKLKPYEFQIQTSAGPYIVHCEHLKLNDLKDIKLENDIPDMSILAKYLRWMSRLDGNNVINLTDSEKLELFGQLEASIAHEIGKYAQEQPKMNLEIEIECPECGEIRKGSLTDFFI